MQYPKISAVVQKKHGGESVAMVNGKIVAFGKNSLEADENAQALGYGSEDVIIAYIYKVNQNYVL